MSMALAVSTSATASWNEAATSASANGRPARRSVSTQRETAVFSPEKEKSKRCCSRSWRAVRPRGNRIAFGSPSAASRSMTGPPG